MVVPIWVVAEKAFIQNAAMTLLRNICNPYATDAISMLLGSLQNLFPEGLVELLGCISVTSSIVRDIACLDKSIGMAPNNCNIPRLRVRIVQWDVLLDCEMQYVFLLVRCRPGVLSYVLAWHHMLHDTEELGRHIQRAC